MIYPHANYVKWITLGISGKQKGRQYKAASLCLNIYLIASGSIIPDTGGDYSTVYLFRKATKVILILFGGRV